MTSNLIGQLYKFEDGNSIEIIQIKQRDDGDSATDWVTFHVQQGNGIPQKLLMTHTEFISTYGHLFTK